MVSLWLGLGIGEGPFVAAGGRRAGDRDVRAAAGAARLGVRALHSNVQHHGLSSAQES
jgi:hypothetical protein